MIVKAVGVNKGVPHDAYYTLQDEYKKLRNISSHFYSYYYDYHYHYYYYHSH